MSKGINLISQEGRERLRIAKIRLKLKKFSYFILGFFILFTVVVFGFFFLYQRELSTNERQISLLKSQIESFNKVESLLVTTTDRSEKINKILNERISYVEVLSACSSLMVPGFIPTAIEIKSAGELKISGTCEDLQSLTNLNERVEEIRLRRSYKEIVYPQVSRTAAGKYLLTLELKK